jgi:serine phosphatase RsbU (regulator of sigma subunit)
MARTDESRLRSAGRLDLGALLSAVEAAPPVAAAEVAAAALADAVGAEAVSFLIADFSGDALIRLANGGAPSGARRLGTESGERVPLEGTPHGRALASQDLELEADGDTVLAVAPVTSRGEAVGVLEMSLPDPPDDRGRQEIAQVAHLLAYVVIANGRFTDLFEWGQRSVPLSLAAEIQHRLLPGSYTCEAAQFTLAAWLEPAGNVGGDTFDFSLDRESLSLSMTDAMGHTVNASLLATLVVGSLRNGRRRGAGLAEQARLADAALAEHAGGAQFVTGQIARVDLAAGTAEIVNAGHPPPLRVRDGVVEEVALEADPPFGALPGSTFRTQSLPLRPGDRLLFLTDGVLERQAAKINVSAMLAEGRADHPREAVQRLIQAAVRASGGHLEDDATALCLDWHGGPPRERRAAGGADLPR